jgi:membrane protein DedA with SNARE-associated domain
VFEDLVSRWGYIAVSLGTYVEGEAVLLSAGALAHARVLSLPLVVLAAMLGSAAWGQTWFQIGRMSGRGLMARRPHWQARAAALERWLARFGMWVLLFGRFLAGMGTLLPAMIGASGFPRWRFCVLDSLGAAIWATVLACAGFGIGAGLRKLVGTSPPWLQLVLASVLVALAYLLFRLATSLYAARARRRA